MVISGTVIVLLLPFAWSGYFIAQKHQWAQSKLAELEPRYSRMLGLQAQRSEMTSVLAQAQVNL